jgi:RNA polymerase sigma factor (sigma-70 family)
MPSTTDTFEELYRGYYGRVWRLFRRLGVSDVDASDLAQETFVRVYNHIDEYRGEAKWAYVKTIASHVLVDDVRARTAKKRSGSSIPLDDPDDPLAEMVRSLRAPSDPADELMRVEGARDQRLRLQAAIAELPPQSSQTLRLWLTGLKHAEISRVLMMPEDDVKKRLAQVRRTIRRRLEGVHSFRDDADALDAILAADIIEPVTVAPISEPRLILETPPPPIHVPRMIISVEDALIEAVRREPQSIFAISSRAFEELISGIFKQKGFETELTKATRDGGRDIIAIHEVLGIRSKYIVECKRYAAHRKVTLQLVQRLYGVKTAEAANKAILATTSSFTRDAEKFASHHVWDLELKSFDDIMSWVREYRTEERLGPGLHSST